MIHASTGMIWGGGTMAVDADPAVRKIIEEFAGELAALRQQYGNPSYAAMGNVVRHMKDVEGSRSTFGRMIKRPMVIPSAECLRGFLIALGCAELVDAWEGRRQAAQAAIEAARGQIAGDAAARQSENTPATTAQELAPSAGPRLSPHRSRRWRPFTLGLVCAGIVTFPLGFVTGMASRAAPASNAPGAILGRPDIQAACERDYGNGRIATITNPDSSSSWECLAPGMASEPDKSGVAISDQCARQWPGSESRALSDRDPWSWRCIQRG